jgi:hypothetical protein
LDSTVTLQISSADGGGVNAYAILVHFQSTDFSPSTSSSASAPSPPKTQPATVTVTPATAGGAAGLSGGAKAGIGVGVVIIVLGLALMGAMIFIYRQRRRMLGQASAGAPHATAYDDGAGEPAGPPAMADLPPSSTPDRNGPYMDALYVPVAPGMAPSRNNSTGELAGSFPEEMQAQGSGEVDRSEEEVRRRLNRAREERESLARIVQLNRLEETLESQLANRRHNGSGSPAGV